MKLLDAIRLGVIELRKNSNLPYSVEFNERDYFKYISLFRNDIPNFLAIDYVLYKHKHEDWYIHTTSKEAAEKIVSNGYLDSQYFSENGSVGRAIYTFPLDSGRAYLKDNCCLLLFKSSLEHCHIVGAVDSIHCLGESIFKQDKIELEDCRILSNDEFLKLDRGAIGERELKHYFGIPECVSRDYNEVNFKNLEQIVENSYNSIEFPTEFYDLLQKDFGEIDEIEIFDNTKLF